MASGLSIHDDGLLVDPMLRPCEGSLLSPLSLGCTDLEAELRGFLNQFSTTFLKPPSGDSVTEFRCLDSLSGSSPKSVCINHLELFDIWFHKYHNKNLFDERMLLCPDFKRRIQGLIHKILSERVAMLREGGASFLKEGDVLVGSLVACEGLKRKFESPSDFLTWLQDAAIDPCNERTSQEVKKLRRQILAVREAFSVGISNPQEYPYQKKRRSAANLSSEKPNVQLNQGLNLPMRRSKRCLEMLKIGESRRPRDRIPLGSEFQADVPDWTGRPNQNNALNSDERWLGIRVWPAECDDVKNSEGTVIGKGRPDLCSCPLPGSVACIRSHVSAARLQLQSELGPSFTSLGFDEMGEDVSKSWTLDEQLIFDTIVRQNPLSEGKRFWEAALRTFPSKSKKSIVGYYFNVFVLRRMCNQTRVAASAIIDSDDDESNCKAPEASYCTYSPTRQYVAANLPSICHRGSSATPIWTHGAHMFADYSYFSQVMLHDHQMSAALSFKPKKFKSLRWKP